MKLAATGLAFTMDGEGHGADREWCRTMYCRLSLGATMTSMPGGRVRLVVGDPFSLAGQGHAGRIVEVEQSIPGRVLVALVPPMVFGGVEYRHVVLAARGADCLSVTGSTREVGGIGLRNPPSSSDGAWGSESWRGGGLAFLASLTWCGQVG